MKKIFSLILCLAMLTSVFAIPTMAATDGDKCSVDIYSRIRNVGWATWWNDNNNYTYVPATGTERGYYKLEFTGSNNHLINTNGTNEYNWDLFPNKSNGYFKITLKVPEGKLPTGNTYVEIADINYNYNLSADVTKQINVEEEWIDVIVPLTRFTADNFNYSQVRRLQLRTESATEFYVSGVGLYYTPQKYYDICSDGVMGSFWFNNVSGSGQIVNNVGSGNQVPFTKITDGDESYYNMHIDLTKTTSSGTELGTALEINCNDNKYPMILNAISKDAFIRMTMRCSTVPINFRMKLTNATWGWTGELEKATNNIGWQPNEWFTVDIPIKEFGYFGGGFKLDNVVRVNLIVRFPNKTVQDLNIKEIGIYGPERKFDLLDFQLLKDGLPVTEYNAGDELTLSASTYNTLPENYNFTLTGAVYEDEFTLENVDFKNVAAKPNAGFTTVTAKYTVPSDVSGTTLKAFAFNHMDGLQPLIESIGATQTVTAD